MNPRILITGKNGQLGWELQRSLASFGAITALDRQGLDLADSDSIRSVIRTVRPHVIVNAAAYTAVDRAESEPGLAMQINGIAPGIMAEEAQRLGALLIHYSTDYVFDGSKLGPYVEADPPQPLNAYGRSKLAGEVGVMATGGPHLLFRTSWVYSARGNNFVRTMLRLARERSELRIVDDQEGAPTHARSIAEMTAAVLGSSGGNLEALRDRSGLYHFTAAGSVSWFGFAKAVFSEAAGVMPCFRMPSLIPIPTSGFPAPARRPVNSRLSTARLTAAFGVVPSAWEATLRNCIRELAN